MVIGDKSQKILVIADIHGNCEALRAVLDNESDFDTVVFLGDSISPGPQPKETLSLLSTLPGIHIRGNHDLEMLDPSLTENWPPPWKAFDDWVRSQLTSANLNFLRDLKHDGDYIIGNSKIRLCHGYAPRTFRHVLPNSPNKDFEAIAGSRKTRHVLFGHSHIQFRKHVGEQEFINPGSVGQNRCGHLTACYGVIEKGDFHHRRVTYNPEPWIDALYRVDSLDPFSEFREWFKESLLSGFGVGRTEPWIRFAHEGFV